MALTTYHHGITATETSNITPIIKSVSMSTIALVSTSVDADNTKYPLDTPVLLTGITTDDVTKAGAKDTLLSQCLQTIKSIQNTNVVVLRLSEPVDIATVDTLLSAQSRLGVTPKILIAPEIDTPAMTRKLVEIAKKRRAFVYASPRAEDGTLITVKEDIVAYRDTFAARELMLIEGGFGALGKSNGGDEFICTPTNISFQTPENSDLIESGDSGLVHARYRVNGGEWVDYTREFGSMVDWYSAVDGFFISMEDYIDSFGQTKPFTRRFGEYGPDHLGLAGAPSSGSISELNGHSLLSYDMPTGEETGTEVLEEVTTTIEFVVSDGEGADLVQELFGGDYTAISCGTVKWSVNF